MRVSGGRIPASKVQEGQVVRTSGLGDVLVREVLQDGLSLIVEDAQGLTHDVRTRDGHWLLALPGTVQEGLFEPDRLVSIDEVRALTEELALRHELWNGMTGHYLRERYGDRLYHVTGRGWYVRAEGGPG